MFVFTSLVYRIVLVAPRIDMEASRCILDEAVNEHRLEEERMRLAAAIGI
jgi:hypothetical protein